MRFHSTYVLLVALMFGAAQASDKQFTGTATPICGVTDGPASKIILVQSDDRESKIEIFVHDLTPNMLGGDVKIVSEYYSPKTAKLRICPSGSSCFASDGGILRVLSNNKSAINGTLRYISKDHEWRQVTFVAQITRAPTNMICG